MNHPIIPGYFFDARTNRYYEENGYKEMQRESQEKNSKEEVVPKNCLKRKKLAIVDNASFEAPRWIIERTLRKRVTSQALQNSPSYLLDLSLSKNDRIMSGSKGRRIYFSFDKGETWSCHEAATRPEAIHSTHTLDEFRLGVSNWHPTDEVLYYSFERNLHYLNFMTSRRCKIPLNDETVSMCVKPDGSGLLTLPRAKRQGSLYNEELQLVMRAPKWKSDPLSCLFTSPMSALIGFRDGKLSTWDARENLKSLSEALYEQPIGPITMLSRSSSCDHVVFMYSPLDIQQPSSYLMDLRFMKHAVASFDVFSPISGPKPVICSTTGTGIGDVVLAFDYKTQVCKVFEVDSAKFLAACSFPIKSDCLSFSTISRTLVTDLGFVFSTPHGLFKTTEITED